MSTDLNFGARRLTDTERKEWQGRFQVRMSPDAMIALVDELQNTTGLSMMIQAGVEFFRDAWTAAHFAKVRRAQEVRLWPDTRPDFEMNLNGTYDLFEVTEAGEPGRRGDEYRAFEARQLAAAAAGDDSYVEVEHDPVGDWGVEQAPAMLEQAATHKAKGNYNPSWGLVIYLNLGEYGFFRRQVETCLKAATAPAKDHFREVWVLWDGRAYLTWRRG